MDESQDKSKSAQRERQLMAAHNERQEQEKKDRSWRRKIWQRIRHGSVSSKDGTQDVTEKKQRKALSKSGQDVESGVPPDGRRTPLGSA